MGVALVSSLKRTAHATSWRQPCITCPNVLVRLPTFLPAFVRISNLGKVPRLSSNWTTCSTACASSRLFLWVLILRSYFPGGWLNALASPLEGSTLQIASHHRLGRGLQGYLQFCYCVTKLSSKFKVQNSKFWCRFATNLICYGQKHFCFALHVAMQFGLYHSVSFKFRCCAKFGLTEFRATEFQTNRSQRIVSEGSPLRRLPCWFSAPDTFLL